MERREGSPLPINEVFGRIFEIEAEIDALRTQGNSKDEIRNLYLEKGYNFLLLLKAREAGLVDLRVSLSIYPHETPHKYSQYIAEIVVPRGLNTKRSGTRTGIDLISQGLDGDSRTVIKLIGQPDYAYNESADQMVRRTYDEIRESQRAHTTARIRHDFKTMDELDLLRLSLVERLLQAKKSGKLVNTKMKTKRYRGNRGDLLANIDLGGSDYVTLPLSSEVQEIFERYGGFDRDQLR